MRLAAGTEPPRVLVADDRPYGRQLLARLLQSWGFEVREAADGQQAFEEWARWQPRLVCMDMRMPVVDGREAARRIKATPQGRDTVVIAVTASSFEHEREEVMAVGCDDFLRKPFEESTLLQMLERHLGVRFEPVDAAPTEAIGGASAAPSPETAGELANPAAILAALPAALRARLLQAATHLDVRAVADAIGAIEQADARAAALLRPYERAFRYDRIAALLESADGN
jgi:CheY-like chemotaxis protein